MYRACYPWGSPRSSGLPPGHIEERCLTGEVTIRLRCRRTICYDEEIGHSLETEGDLGTPGREYLFCFVNITALLGRALRNTPRTTNVLSVNSSGMHSACVFCNKENGDFLLICAWLVHLEFEYLILAGGTYGQCFFHSDSVAYHFLLQGRI